MSTEFTINAARTGNAVSGSVTNAVGLQTGRVVISYIINGFSIGSEPRWIFLEMARLLISLKLSLRTTHNQEVQL
jgi:hypothetical protein